MREIKFRAYQPHPSYHRKPGMYEVESLHFYDDQEGHGEAFFKGEKSSEYLDDIKLMQYTDLKDKNNKEIYEGDIVRDMGVVCEVTYEDGYFSPLAQSPKSSFVESGEPYRYPDECEVIGNIYENPELLTPPKSKQDKRKEK